MNKEINFPNGGFVVKVIHKEDIINAIDHNITDKDVALALIKQLELDASNFIARGRWTGIPHLGNIRVPFYKQLLEKQQENGLLDAAKELLDTKQYILFRGELTVNSQNKAKAETYYKYICSMAANHNRKLYRRLVTNYGAVYARLKLFFGHTVIGVDNEYDITIDE